MIRAARRPPRLLVKTLAVTFLTVSALLAIVFAFVTMRARAQVRESVIGNLEATQRLFAALEQRWQRELRAQAANLAESPTLKAALDTYSSELGINAAATASLGGSSDATRTQLLTTISSELAKVAERTESESDAIVLVDSRQHTLAAAGRLASLWPPGRPVTLIAAAKDAGNFDGVVALGENTFRVVTVPLVLGDGTIIGTLYLTTSLDQSYVRAMKQLSGAEIAVARDGLLLATTLPGAAAREFETYIGQARNTVSGTPELAAESFAFRRLVQVGDTVFYALASIDGSSRQLLQAVRRDLVFMAIGAVALALLGSIWLAQLLTGPIGRLSGSLEAMAASHTVDAHLPLTGSSREIDTLTDTFNALMGSVAVAEAQTEAACTGAIQALATALDAKDPYTAGHSERVSVLSVAIGRTIGLPADDLEVLRLGALLHDIGKIGVPDDVLRKPGALTADEFDAIKQHPVLGARILRSVPFLAKYLLIVELHHESPDGRGYPRGLRGDEIPLVARIVHAADAYDAMTSARAYRAAMPADAAMRELWRCAGTQFHAEIVAALTRALPGVTSSFRELETEMVAEVVGG
jgi:putative nucleotidyltransferase with HDIG domain